MAGRHGAVTPMPGGSSGVPEPMPMPMPMPPKDPSMDPPDLPGQEDTGSGGGISPAKKAAVGVALLVIAWYVWG